jgi:hypothetical protein
LLHLLQGLCKRKGQHDGYKDHARRYGSFHNFTGF